jgi:hypothetical protein
MGDAEHLKQATPERDETYITLSERADTAADELSFVLSAQGIAIRDAIRTALHDGTDRRSGSRGRSRRASRRQAPDLIGNTVAVRVPRRSLSSSPYALDLRCC